MKYLIIIPILSLFCSNVKQQEEVEMFCRYAETFSVMTRNNIIPSLPPLEGVDESNFEKAKIINRKRVNQAIALIILKLYEAQLKCCGQGYEICQDSIKCKLEYEFLIFTKMISSDYSEMPPNFITTGNVYEWLLDNEEFSKNYRPLDIQLKNIRKIKS